MEEIKAINKSLYEARLARKETLKSAAKALGIFKLHLDLIEKGYLPVTKKLKLKFIKYYKLNEDFFNTHSTYIDPINNHVEDDKAILKFRQVVSAKPVRIVTGALSVIGAGLLAFGVFIGSKIYTNPREAWSNNYTQFRAELIRQEPEEHIDELVGDKYYLLSRTINATKKLDTKIYKSNLNAADTNFVFSYENENYVITFDIYCYNKRIIAFTTYQDEHLLLEDASCFIKGNSEFNLRPFNYSSDTSSGKAKPGDPIYEKVNSVINNDLVMLMNDYNNEVLTDSAFIYHNVYDIFVDVKRISYDYVSNFRLGYNFKMTGGIMFGVALSCFALSFLIKPKTKLKTKELPSVNFSLASVSLPARKLPSDTKVPLIFPEFFLRIVGLMIILFFAIGLNIATAWRINSDLLEEVPKKITMLQEISSNLFVAGTTLLFFLKLDIYHKKSQKDLLTNIFILFVIGLIYYVMEVVLYTSVADEFTNGGGIFKAIMLILTTFLPGNIIWNLMLYSCIFYFLFTTPKKCQDSLHKTLRFRLLSLLPTLFLLISFIYQTFIKPVAPAPYFISCIFFTKGFLITLFAIVYLYALYFLQTYYRFRFGEETAKIYFYSRRYNLTKNIMAAIIILVLFGIDLFFMYKIPDNSLNLGNNWAIILIVPLILFYRPHIGKRNEKWDSIFLLLYLFFFVGGFISVISQIASLFDFSQLAEILN